MSVDGRRGVTGCAAAAGELNVGSHGVRPPVCLGNPPPVYKGP